MTVEIVLADKGRDVKFVSDDTTVEEAVRILAAMRIGAVLVKPRGGEELAGIFSERDLVRGLAEHGPEVLQKPVSSLMTAKLITCGPRDNLNDLMALMTERRIRHIPVLDDGVLRGIVSIGDVVKHRMRSLELEASSLREYVTGSY